MLSYLSYLLFIVNKDTINFLIPQITINFLIPQIKLSFNIYKMLVTLHLRVWAISLLYTIIFAEITMQNLHVCAWDRNV